MAAWADFMDRILRYTCLENDHDSAQKTSDHTRLSIYTEDIDICSSYVTTRMEPVAIMSHQIKGNTHTIKLIYR